MALDVRVNGQVYTLWETASVGRSLDNVCGNFAFATSNRPDTYPVQDGDRIQILVEGKVVLTGYVFEMDSTFAIGTSQVSISGRDITADLIDSSIPDSAKELSGGSIKDMCEAVVRGLGLPIRVIDQSGGIAPFDPDSIESAEVGGNCFDFLDSFARRRQVYLITSPTGDLIIYRPSGQAATTQIINKRNSNANNVLSCSVRRSSSERYYKYRFASQENAGDALFSYGSQSDDTDNRGEAFDKGIRKTRYLEVISEEAMEEGDCNNRAKEESNLRRARGIEYTATLAGATQRDGQLWAPGLLVRVDDEVLNVRGIFLIRSIKISEELGGAGTQTEITVAQPDAYKAQDIVTPAVKRTAKIETQ